MIGILGGTFDPIHRGHVHIAIEARARLGLEQVHFMPCATPVHRRAARAGAAARCAMIETAIAGREGCVLNRMEVDRAGASWTVDSLRQLRRERDDTLALLLGSDAFNAFDTWRQPDAILELANLAVCRRPGARLDPGRFAARLAQSVAEFGASRHGAIIDLEVGAPDCSSSALRQRLAAGLPAGDCLHPGVARYIEQHRLYRDPND